MRGVTEGLMFASAMSGAADPGEAAARNAQEEQSLFLYTQSILYREEKAKGRFDILVAVPCPIIRQPGILRSDLDGTRTPSPSCNAITHSTQPHLMSDRI